RCGTARAGYASGCRAANDGITISKPDKRAPETNVRIPIRPHPALLRLVLVGVPGASAMPGRRRSKSLKSLDRPPGAPADVPGAVPGLSAAVPALCRAASVARVTQVSESSFPVAGHARCSVDWA